MYERPYGEVFEREVEVDNKTSQVIIMKRWKYLGVYCICGIILFIVGCYPKLTNSPERIISYQFMGVKQFELITYHKCLLDSIEIESKYDKLDLDYFCELNKNTDLPIYHDLISINNDSLPILFSVRFFGHERLELMCIYDLKTNKKMDCYKNNEEMCDNKFLIEYFNRNYFDKFRNKFQKYFYNETICYPVSSSN